jgi:hypothetical protein
MRRIILGITAGVLALGLTASTAEARGGRHHGHGGRHHSHHGKFNYYQRYGHRFHGGYYYEAARHPRWAKRVYVPRYRCYHYFDADLNCWYYFDTGHRCYYPVAYRH